MAEIGKDSVGDSGKTGTRPRLLGCAAYCIAWLFLWVITLASVVVTVSGYLTRETVEGYQIFTALTGIYVIMPISFAVSCVIYAVWRRVWLFLVFAVVSAAGTSLAFWVWLILGQR